MSENAIEINGLTKRFGGKREKVLEAVSGFTLNIGSGEMFGLVGPDGAGKTTLIRMLTGIAAPSEGTATLLGLDLIKDLPKIKPQIGYLSQKFSLYPDLTIDENIEFFAEIHEVPEYKPRRDELLEFTRLTSFRDRLADQLSGAMKQKLALACTLIHTPKIIFLDEPTTGVDPVSRRDFWKILSSLLKGGITIVMTTPYLDEAERCSRVGLMNGGKLLVADTPQNVKKQMKGTIVEVVCRDVRAAYKLLKKEPEVTEVQAFGDRLNLVLFNPDVDEPKLKLWLEGHGIEVQHLRIVQPSLENVFISLMPKQGETVEAAA